MKIEAQFDAATYTLTYIVWDENTRDAVIIDPVMDYEPAGSTYWYESIDRVMGFVKAQKLKVHLLMETHAHADHLSGSQELKKRLSSPRIAIGKNISKVQEVFKGVFNLDPAFKTDGSQFDLLLGDGEEVVAGSLKVKVLHTPGHTPACSSYLIEDALFVGDALFMPDYGVGRCDFPAGSATDLYQSIKNRIYSLPDETRVFTGHDYQPGGRPLRYEATVGESKRTNKQIQDKTTKEEFVKFRTDRDRTLSAPRLLLPSVLVNIDAGRIPPPENNGMSYLKLPIRPASSVSG